MKIYSDLATLPSTVNMNTLIDARRIGSPIKYVRAVVLLSAALAVADILELFNLPEGAEIQVDQCTVVPLAGTGDIALNFGDATDPDAYGVSVPVNLATTKVISFAEGASVPVGLLTPFDADGDRRNVTGTVTVVTAAPSADAKVMIKLAYKL